jgi:2-polyprenyl-6-methoxyphenol hydroxylase-like FAD-dependent oxidoreductase
MRIIIVGGGIAGLSTYLHLRKHLSREHDITIYESHKPRTALTLASSPGSSPNETLDSLSVSTALVGGGLGISPNGMRVLLNLDKSLHDSVVAQGFPAEHFVFKGANGWTLGMQKTSDVSIRKRGEEGEVCIASSRHGLWETLMKNVAEGVVQYRKVLGTEINDDGKVIVRVLNEDGNETNDIADLVVGADGVRSVVRGALFQNEVEAEYT